MSILSVGAALIKTLNHLKVDHFFATPGSEFGPIIQEFYQSKETLNIRPQLCAHEFLAVSMAYGAYFKTKRPQAVMTHANVGAANALIGLIGAHRMNIPIIFISGQTSALERGEVSGRDRIIHWSQDSQSPSLIYKDYVKSVITITHESQVVDAVHRAHNLALMEPMGPVAISISRDVLEKTFSFDELVFTNLNTTVRSPGLSDESQKVISNLLAKSERPLVIGNRLEKNSDSTLFYSEGLIKHQIACLRSEVFYQQGSNFEKLDLTDWKTKALNEADLIFVLDTDAPWVPLSELNNNKTKIVHLGPDPLFSSLPLRSYKADEVMPCSIDSFFHFLQNESASNVASRASWIQSIQILDQRHSLHRDNDQMTPQSVAKILSELMPRYAVLINELSLSQKYLKLEESIHYFRSGAASPLGWGIGFALGLALHASAETTHYCVVGDGVFHLSPLCSLMTAAENNSAIVIIVLNNKKMQSVIAATEKYAKQKATSWPLTEFGSPFHFEKAALLVNGEGYQANNCLELVDIFEKATSFTQKYRRPAIINIIMSS